jgi:hypothetical protein
MIVPGASVRVLLAGACAAATVAVACSGDSVRLGAGPSGGRGGNPGRGAGGSNAFAGAGSGSASGGNQAAAGASGVGAAAGTGARAGNAGSCSTGDAGWCAEEITRAENWRADVLVIVDTSPSMAEEVPEVEAALNGFAERIRASQVDLRLALLAAPPRGQVSGPSICVPAPLGSGACPPQGDDTAFPSFFHHSTAALDEQTDVVAVLRSTSPEVAQFLRPDVKTALVIVSDGNGSSDLQSSYWDPQFMPTFVQTKFSALYAFTPCAGSRAEGTVYRALVRSTGGAQGDLCSEPIKSALNRVADDVVAQQICEVPLPPNSRTIDGFDVRVLFTADGAPEEVNYVGALEACDPLRGGWYDIPRNPEGHVRRLCPATCAAFRADPNSTVTTQLACDRPPIPC